MIAARKCNHEGTKSAKVYEWVYARFASAVLRVPFVIFVIFVSSWRISDPRRTVKNWAANYEYVASAGGSPQSAEELCALVREAKQVKPLGTRHSFNDIADTTGTLISLEHFTRIDEPDRERRTVTLEAGVRYGELCRFLHARGFALHNLASLPHISVAGAVATATHGSGVHNGNLATAVRAMEIVGADGNVQHRLARIAWRRVQRHGRVARRVGRRHEAEA